VSKKPKPQAFKSRKVLLATTFQQRLHLKKWLGVYRWTYNKCCELVYDPEWSVPPTLRQLRLLIANERGLKANFPKESEWVLEVPYDWRDKAIVEFVNAYKTQRFSLGKNDSDFTIQFKSKKALYQVCEVDPKHWHGGLIFSSFWKRANLDPLRIRDHGVEKGVNVLPYASKIIYARATRKFYFAMPDSAEVPPSKSVCDSQAGQADAEVVFIDPGVRVFLTAYDSRGRFLEFGVGYDKILEACTRMDKMAGVVSSPSTLGWTRYRLLNKTLPRLRYRLKNMVHDFHSKVAKFLCLNYSDIHLPVFDTSRMLKKNPVRCLASKTARMMCTWSHYKFQNLLRYRAIVSGAAVHIANESYTSKTCSKCGHVNDKSSSKTFKCKNCLLTFDRDMNGAVNIMLRQCSRG
jgi:putative transposase